MRACVIYYGSSNGVMKKIGFTTTIPVEIILSAGHIPVDLNNIFVAHKSPDELIETAHGDGLPRNCCSWIKGLYSVGVKLKAVDEVIAVTNGDCSNTHALAELYSEVGIPVHTFSFPYNEPNPYEALKYQMEHLAISLGTTLEQTYKYCEITDKIRKKLHKIDELTYKGEITGFENHLWLVSSSDFNSDLETFSKSLDNLICDEATRTRTNKNIRIGYIGVPPIMPSIYDFIESKNCKVVFNEVQRQFAIPSYNTADYVSRYIEYTYPYGVADRIKDIKTQVELRQIDGIIHYVQSFCYRQIQDTLIKKHINIPVLTIEGDMPGNLDGRTKIRIDSFIEMLAGKKNK